MPSKVRFTHGAQLLKWRAYRVVFICQAFRALTATVFLLANSSLRGWRQALQTRSNLAFLPSVLIKAMAAACWDSFLLLPVVHGLRAHIYQLSELIRRKP